MKLPCSACSREMHDEATNSVFVAVHITTSQHPAFKRTYPEINSPIINICYVCWLKSLGVKCLVI